MLCSVYRGVCKVVFVRCLQCCVVSAEVSVKLCLSGVWLHCVGVLEVHVESKVMLLTLLIMFASLQG